jgi:hypothetical protein
MPLGICTRYRHCEAAIAAIRLAEWAARAGHEVSLFPVTNSPPRLHKHWDPVAKAGRSRRFAAWAKEQTTVIWTHCPIYQQVTWARKQGAQTGILCLCDEIQPNDVTAYRAADVVLAPSDVVQQYAEKELRVRRAVGLPWDTGEPFTQKDLRLKSEHVWVLMPMFDYEPCRIEATALEIAGRALATNPHMVLTVPYNSSKIAPFTVRRLKEFRHYFGNRVRLLPGIPLETRPLLYATHDLTYWPVCSGGIGTVGITSVTMGTPVLAFDIPVITDFLHQANSVQVPAVAHTAQNGLPYAEPDYNAMEQAMQAILADRAKLRYMQNNTLAGLDRRRKVFETILTRVVN